ncbi:MAG: DEAD/DEAH box helicase family protein, partial [Bryobacteraceae bacterium]|nr:DEAD/DEAH box helicase family protein [Bryobacteraceae bacterium]
MGETESSQYCDVSLPVPLDRPFTYRLPETLRHRAKRGCRMLVPFGSRKLTGVILRVHSESPEVPPKDALRLLDEEPVLDESLLSLACWIAGYYCAPLGEVLRGMMPLAGEIRCTKVYSLTPSGRDAARQLLLGDTGGDPTLEVLRMLEARPLSASYLTKKVPRAPQILKSLEKKGMVEVEEDRTERDPLRAPAARLRVEFIRRPDARLTKAERELIAYLELHPGAHNLQDVETLLPGASAAARSLARRNLVSLRPEPLVPSAGRPRPRHVLNSFQQAAFDSIKAALESRQFTPFLLRGVTGSGKTEVYLRSIEEALRLGRGALLLVPEIALTPAVASQFFQRFGDRVAMLHSAFSDAERADQWRRIQAGAATVVVGTRSSVFAPVRNLGLILVDEEHDGSYKQEEVPRYHGR